MICQDCPHEGRYIAPWGDKSGTTAVVGQEPSVHHPDESGYVFGLDLDWTAWSGEVLEDVFEELNVDISDFYWTNAIKCTVSGNPEACSDVLAHELNGFAKVIVLGNKAADITPEIPGSDRYEIYHPAYIHRNRDKFHQYVRTWADVIGADSPTSLSNFIT